MERHAERAGDGRKGGEQVQRWLPGARVVKAFNIVGNPYMVDPEFPDGVPDMFIAPPGGTYACRRA